MLEEKLHLTMICVLFNELKTLEDCSVVEFPTNLRHERNKWLEMIGWISGSRFIYWASLVKDCDIFLYIYQIRNALFKISNLLPGDGVAEPPTNFHTDIRRSLWNC